MVKVPSKLPKTQPEADAQWARIMKAMRRIDGYQAFGYDWPTLRLTRPEVYARFKEINRIYDSLPA